MKVDQAQKPFCQITITVESETELKSLEELLVCGLRGGPPNKITRNFGMDLLDKIEKSQT